MCSSKTRQPARDFREIFFVRRAKSLFEVRFFIQCNEQVHRDEEQDGISQQIPISKPQEMTEQDQKYTDIHWITDVSIQARDDQFLWRVDGRGRPLPFLGE